MAEIRAKRTLIKEVERKVQAGECLICGAEANGNRGLCVAHHMKFYRAMNALPKKDRPAFEEEHIREGRILAAGQLKEIKNPNPFAVEAG